VPGVSYASLCICVGGAEASKSVGKTKEPSFVERLLGNVLKNFEVNVANIHVRYEDPVTKPGTTLTAGVTLKDFSIHVGASSLQLKPKFHFSRHVTTRKARRVVRVVTCRVVSCQSCCTVLVPTWRTTTKQ